MKALGCILENDTITESKGVKAFSENLSLCFDADSVPRYPSVVDVDGPLRKNSLKLACRNAPTCDGLEVA
jgi:hypothetical protein